MNAYLDREHCRREVRRVRLTVTTIQLERPVSEGLALALCRGPWREETERIEVEDGGSDKIQVDHCFERVTGFYARSDGTFLKKNMTLKMVAFFDNSPSTLAE